MKIIKVSVDKPDTFHTIQEAVWEAEKYTEEAIIEITEGIYHEKLEIRRNNLTLRGLDASTTIIQYGDYGYFKMPDGEKRGTFRSQTMFLEGDNIRLENITIANTAGYGKEIGQAVALYADGKQHWYEGCRFLGYQDTLFLAPLPPKEYEVNGFRGPKQFAPRNPGSYYLKNCYIEGTVDYIFGGGEAYFYQCELKSLNDKSVCYVTAASTPEGQKSGFVFYKCRFTGASSEKNVYLGRPWREYAKTVIIESELEECIAECGWNDWGKTDTHKTIEYMEAGNTGAGAAGVRAEYAKQVDMEEAKHYILYFDDFVSTI